jgi:pentatricopeptide repeat protein
MIVAFGQHGLGREASSLFRKMQSEGIKPDSISFIAVMNACCHNGLVEEGLWFFLSMEEGHGHVHIIIDHYVCVIDLLGRAGRLDEAESAVRSIPCKGTVVAWLCLLACCRIHGDVERGSSAANHCFRLDPEHGAPYIVLSNLYYTGLIPADLKE